MYIETHHGSAISVLHIKELPMYYHYNTDQPFGPITLILMYFVWVDQRVQLFYNYHMV